MTEPEITLAVSQNQYLSVGDREMNTILTVTAAQLGPAAHAAEVVLVDCSGSMAHPPTKIAAAQRATAAAIDTLREGSLFAVVQGTDRATLVYPPTPPLAVASPATREEAKEAVQYLVAGGYTKIGQWLRCARDLLDPHPDAIRHAILLTDGHNQHETPAQLDQILAECAGRFSCDARGIGDDWEPAELLRIVAVLRGKAESVREHELTADFKAMTAEAMNKVIPDLKLRIRTLPGTTVQSLRQVFPTHVDLTGDLVRVDDRTAEVSTGSWGHQTADYHLCLRVEPNDRPMRQDIQVALIAIEAVGTDGRRRPVGAPPAGVLVHWTDDPVRATRVNEKLGHYLEQADLRNAVNAGADAYDSGDLDQAAAEWGRAVQLATASRHDKMVQRLNAVVHIDDAAAGLVRLKELTLGDMKALILSSHTSTLGTDGMPVPETAPPAAGSGSQSAADIVCPVCERTSPAKARSCTQCRTKFPGLREGPGGD